jgi:hypothetical protein
MPHSTTVRTTATWKIPYSDETWKKIVELQAETSKESRTPRRADVVVLGPCLPDRRDPRIATLVAHRHHARDAEGVEISDEIHFSFKVGLPPPGEPPEDVIASSKKLGGAEKFARLLADWIPAGTPQVASFTIQFRVAGSNHHCSVLPTVVAGGAHAAASNLGKVAKLEQIGYRFEGGVSGLEEVAIIYLHSPRVFSVNAAARGMLKLNSDNWLPYADEIVELILGAFFTQKEAER